MAYQVGYVCFQGKSRLPQHTHPLLETFWTLQVSRDPWWVTWYKMDGLNRKRYTRSPILMESTIKVNLIKPCSPFPDRYWTQCLKYYVKQRVSICNDSDLYILINPIVYFINKEYKLSTSVHFKLYNFLFELVWSI